MIPSGLFTSNRLHRVSSGKLDAVKRLAHQGCFGITADNARFLSFEVEHHIH